MEEKYKEIEKRLKNLEKENEKLQSKEEKSRQYMLQQLQASTQLYSTQRKRILQANLISTTAIIISIATILLVLLK